MSETSTAKASYRINLIPYRMKIYRNIGALRYKWQLLNNKIDEEVIDYGYTYTVWGAKWAARRAHYKHVTVDTKTAIYEEDLA